MIVTASNIHSDICKEFFTHWRRLVSLCTRDDLLTGPIIMHYINPCVQRCLDPFMYSSLVSLVEEVGSVDLRVLQTKAVAGNVKWKMGVSALNPLYSLYKYHVDSVFSGTSFTIQIYRFDKNVLPRFGSNLMTWSPTYDEVALDREVLNVRQLQHEWYKGKPSFVTAPHIKREIFEAQEDFYYGSGITLSELQLIQKQVYTISLASPLEFELFSVQNIPKPQLTEETKYYCCICTEDNTNDSVYFVSKCSKPHRYHLTCIVRYFETRTPQNKASCPLCKRSWDRLLDDCCMKPMSGEEDDETTYVSDDYEDGYQTQEESIVFTDDDEPVMFNRDILL